MKSALNPEAPKGAQKPSQAGLHVIIDGRQFYQGHKDAWRFGVVTDDSHAICATVECSPRGRERKPRLVTVAKSWLLKDTPEARATLQRLGIPTP